MTVFDYLVAFILTCSVVISMMRGLVREVLSLVSWIAAFLVASAFCDGLAVLLPDVVPGSTVRLIVAFVLLFIGVKLLMMLATAAVDSVVRASGLKVVDRGLGALFGLTRGVVIILAVALVCGMTAIPQQGFWKEALLREAVETGARSAMPFLPGHLSENVKF